jgi:hypothetical protein
MTSPRLQLDTLYTNLGRLDAERLAADARAQGWAASVRSLFGSSYEVRKSRLA